MPAELLWLRKRKGCRPGERIWQTRCGTYRIRWRDAYDGIRLRPLYYSLVHNAVKQHGGDVAMIWEVLGRHTGLGPAKAKCEQHATQQHSKEKSHVRSTNRRRRAH